MGKTLARFPLCCSHSDSYIHTYSYGHSKCDSYLNDYGYTNAYSYHLADNADGGSSLRHLWRNG